MMAPETSRRLAWSIGLVSIAFMLARLALIFADRSTVLDDSAVGLVGAVGWTLDVVLGDVVTLAVPIIGILLATRVPENRLGWMFLLAGVFVAISRLRPGLRTARALDRPWHLAGWSDRTVVRDVGLDRADRSAPPGGPAVPDGPPALPLVAPRVLVHGDRCRPPRERGHGVRHDPRHGVLFESEVTGVVGLVFFLAFLGIVVALVLSVAAVVVRFRAAHGVERLQLKGFLAAAVLFAGRS